MQQETWRREDSAVQRRVADLKAAGLSPILAAGSAASTSAPIHLETPQISGDAVGTAIQSMRMRQDIAVSKAQQDLINRQYDVAGIDYENKKAEGYVTRGVAEMMQREPSLGAQLLLKSYNAKVAEADAAKRNAEEAVRNTDLARQYGVASNSAGALDAINSIRLLNQGPAKPNINPAWAGILQLIKSLR